MSSSGGSDFAILFKNSSVVLAGRHGKHLPLLLIQRILHCVLAVFYSCLKHMTRSDLKLTPLPLSAQCRLEEDTLMVAADTRRF